MEKRHLVKGERFMETLEAKIIRDQDKTSLSLDFKTQILEILLSSDNANDIKIVFNEMIKELKSREFEFILSDEQQDLYNLVCKEYIKQLNSELKTIRLELVDSGLAVV